jgi:predicted DNA-binding transcriptional regulator AlpA
MKNPPLERALWTETESFAYASYGRSFGLKEVKAGRFPAPVRLGPRLKRYVAEEVKQCVAARIAAAPRGFADAPTMGGSKREVATA